MAIPRKKSSAPLKRVYVMNPAFKSLQKAAPEGMSYCIGHEDYLPTESFGTRQGGKYIRSECRPCYNQRLKRWRDSKNVTLNGIVRKGVWLTRKYGIYVEDYVEMYKQQDGRCAICGIKPETELPVVDHNHDTGAVRELLCRHCNGLIGFAKEDIETLKKAVAYLEKHNG